MTEFWELKSLIWPTEDIRVPVVNANSVRLAEAEAVGGTTKTSACDKRAGQEFTSHRLQTQSSFNFTYRMGFTGGSAGKESACNVGDLGSIPRLGRSPGEGKGHPLQYSVHGILQARILEWVAFPFSRGSSQPRDRTQVSHIAGGFFTS